MFELTSIFLDPTGRALIAIQDELVGQYPSYKEGSFDISALVNELKEVVSTDYIDVNTQIQLWLRERNEDSAIGAKLVTFLQNYYDWLYAEHGSEYVLDDRFADVKDIDNCPEDLLYLFLDLYAPGFKDLTQNPSEIIVVNDDGDVLNIVEESSLSPFLTIKNIRDFLRSIKTRFNNTKGTDVSIAYFFITLLGAKMVNIINGDGEYTLQVTFQDNNPISSDDYLESYLKLIHPIGTKLNFEASVTNINFDVGQLQGGATGGSGGMFLTAVPPQQPWQIMGSGHGSYEGNVGGSGQEVSVLGNYFPYTLGDTLSIAATAGCSGATVGGITSGATGSTANMTTYAFPSWAQEIVAGASFGLINTFDFCFLTSPSGVTSPNDGRQTNHSCPIGGYS